MAFDMEDFVVSKPSQNAPNLRFRSIACAMKKTAQNVRPSENHRHSNLPRLLPFKRNRYSRQGNQMRHPHTFNAVLVSAGFESKHGDFWHFQTVGGTFQTVGGIFFEKHGDFKPV